MKYSVSAHSQSFLRRFLLVLCLLYAAALPGQAQVKDSPFDVKCGDTVIGTVTFDTYKDTSTATENSILIEGGFNANGKCKQADGYGYRWLQTVSSNAPIYDWQAKDTTYMDRTRIGTTDNKFVADKSPFYKFYRGPDPANKYNLGFSDNPSRDPASKPFDGTWTLYLVCADLSGGGDISNKNLTPAVNKKRDIDVITAFTWGFTVDKDGNVKVKAPITQQTGAAFDTAYGALDTAFNTTDPDQKTFGDSWTLSQGCCCVPEAGSFALFAFGGVPFACLIVKRRRREE